MAETKTFVVKDIYVGSRFDEVLLDLGAAPSRTKAKTIIDDKKALINNHEEKAHYQLRIDDVITYQEYTNKPLKVQGEDIPLDVIYEDDQVLVINKPAGLVVHPGNGHREGTLVNALVYRESSLAHEGDPIRPGIVHRIDKDTSGLLAIAKTDEAYEYLAKQLSDHSMHREYFALVKGIINEDDGKIDAPIGRDKNSPIKFAVDPVNGKEAVTFFHVEKRFYESDVSFISCRLQTGRTHQIRVHLDYIGHPVIGDPLYGKNNKALYGKGQLLHAYRLSFAHPTTHKDMSFEAPLPDYFEDVLKGLR